MSIAGFQTLKCPRCQQTHVHQLGELVWQEGKGQAFRPVGYYCFFCAKPFDTEGAIRVIKQKELADKIKELESGSR